MNRAAARTCSLIVAIALAGCGPASSSEKQARETAPKEAAQPEPPPPGGSPNPPASRLPPPTCERTSPRKPGAEQPPVEVNGALIRGGEGLRRLRRESGDAFVVVRGGDFSGADLRGARLGNMCFVETNFAGSDWRGARAADTGFFFSDLTGARLRSVSMPRVRFERPFLAQVDAAGADFSGGRIAGTEYGGWDGLSLDGANLRGFRFNCLPVPGSKCVAGWEKVSFRNADLSGAWIDTFAGDGDWTGARLDGTRVDVRKLPELGSARIAGSLIVYESPVAVRLSPSDYRWLGRHVARRVGDSAGGGGAARPPSWIRPGAEALFVAPRIDFDAVALRSPIFRRLLPAVVAGAIAYVQVKVDRRSRLSADGEALGPNAHLCSLAAKRLTFGRNGWYWGVAPPVHAWEKSANAPVPVLRFRSGRLQVYEGGHPSDDAVLRNGFDVLVMCGANARFEDMIRVPFPPG